MMLWMRDFILQIFSLVFFSKFKRKRKIQTFCAVHKTICWHLRADAVIRNSKHATVWIIRFSFCLHFLFYFISFVLLTFVRLSFLFVFCFFAIVVIGLANFLTCVVKWYVLDHNGMQKKKEFGFFFLFEKRQTL